MEELFSTSEAETLAAGASLAARLAAGDLVLLSGPLGAGKTTLVRGIVAALGHTSIVRSPTYNLLQTFDTEPPVMHADLYRVTSHEGLGIEDYLETHLCLVEWPDRAATLAELSTAWRIGIEFFDGGRKIVVQPPGA